MPIVVSDKYRSKGTVKPSYLGEEVSLLNVSPQQDEYMVEGYIDLGNMDNGDEVIITEYVAVDGINLRRFNGVTFADKQDLPIMRIHTKTLDRTFRYRVTLTQTKGVLREYPYAFIIEVLGRV